MHEHVTTKRRCCAFLAFLLAGVIPQSHAADLMEVYALAVDSDPTFRRVAAAKRAVLELRPQALAQLLPSLNGTANTFENDQDISSAFIVGGQGSELNFNSHGYSLNLTQPIFRRDRFLRYRQAGSQIKQADAELMAAQEDLIVRVAERYFLVLGTMDNLEFAQAEKRSLGRQLEQARQRFDVGLTAITDVQEAQAGYDRAVAQEIEAVNLLDGARERLREVIGQYLTELLILGEKMPLLAPDPQDIDQWTETALTQNLDVTAATHAVDVARQEISVQSSGHFPTLDLQARGGYDKTGGRFSDTKIHSTAVGIELNVPIYQGGFVSSKTREAQQRLDERLEVLEFTRRTAQRTTRESYLSVISGISQVEALKQALVSTETALEATQAGFDVGTRTAVDVVAAERATLQARRDYARARYDYLLNTLRLRQAAGTLSDQDLSHVNGWLN
ncbi:MAG: TolC family outer membrane protein [Gammaproteobacteria bacterium]|nr:TolC family outer membrane protein [Gammaproteobacteria bacterium]